MPENKDLGRLFKTSSQSPDQVNQIPGDLRLIEQPFNNDTRGESKAKKVWKSLKKAPGLAVKGVRLGKKAVETVGEIPSMAVNRLADGVDEAQTRVTQDMPKLKKSLWTGAVVVGASAIVRGAYEIGQAKKKVEDLNLITKQNTQEEVDALDNTRYGDNYSVEGMSGPDVRIPILTDPGHINNEQVIILTAKDGPAWILPVKENGDQQALPENAQFLAGELASQLTGVTSSEIISNWVVWHNNPTDFLNFLQTHGANSKVIDWYKYSLDVISHDSNLETWQDRIDDLQRYEPQGNILIEEGEVFANLPDFNEAVDVVCEATGLDFASIRGAMETVAVCGGDAVEMVNSYAYIPDVHHSIAGEIEMSSSAYILIPLFLLRIGNNMVKDLGGKMKNWLDKREYRQMFNELKERGKSFLAKK